MMKNKKLVLLLLLYVLFIGVAIMSATTLTKYFTDNEVSGNFDIGKNLYFQYERGDLFRNNRLIVGVEVEDIEYANDGSIKNISRRIETMNVIPGDTLVYHFYVSNYNETTFENNGIDGVFHAYGSALLAMPVKSSTYDLNSEIIYREVDNEGNPIPGEKGTFRKFTTDLDVDLPKYDKTNPDTYTRFEFQISVTLNDQVENTDTDDYFDATLSIYLSIVCANKI